VRQWHHYLEPAQMNTLARTHTYVAGNYAWDNVNGNPCAGWTPTDGEGIIFDTFDANNCTQLALNSQRCRSDALAG
jgi:hypothetical protein